jgi:poly(3-hydroxybutyrate) depolymerase
MTERVDPCASVASAGYGETAFEFDNETRPVDLYWSDRAVAVDRPALVIDLHTQSTSLAAGRFEWVVDRSFWDHPMQGAVIAWPLADASSTPAWLQSETFDVDYMRALWDHLTSTVCFDQARVMLSGLGTSSLVAAEVICDTDIPIALAYVGLGGVPSMQNCTPARPVPIVSIEVFEYNPGVGPSWDSPWTSPLAAEQQASGGWAPAPERLAAWAGRYHCTDAAEMVTLPDPGEETARDTILWSHRECDAPLYWFGMENNEPPAIGASEAAYIAAWTSLQQIIASHVGPNA